MSDLFDRLQNELDNRNQDSGISPMDLLELPESMRRIMRQMLRSRSLQKQEVREFVDTWDETDRLNPEDLDKALGMLVDQGWLIQIGEGEKIGYRVNLRRKKGSNLGSNIWGALDSKISKKEDKKD